jgi:hypothetical protein
MFVLFPRVAFSQAISFGTVETTVTWTHPATRVNGDALPVVEIDHYVIETVVRDKAETVIVDRGDTATLPSTTTLESQVLVSPDPVLLSYRIKTVDIYGLESEWSDPATKEEIVGPDSTAIPIKIYIEISVACSSGCTIIPVPTTQ